MKEQLILLGNEAVAYGAVDAGMRVLSSYPGTPSTEITETLEKIKDDTVYAEWAANEKVAAEVALGACIAGARSMCCMKHVGLNVAADAVFTAAYTGVRAGLVLVVADDPGMHSSQNEQDTRMVAMAAHVPVLEPSDAQEAYDFVRLAFAMSEACDLPVILRLTTRISHTRGMVVRAAKEQPGLLPYEKQAEKYVMMPNNARKRKHALLEHLQQAVAFAKQHRINRIESADSQTGVYCAGGCYPYVKEAAPTVAVCKIGMPYPLDEELTQAFAKDYEQLYVVEELEPCMEMQLNQTKIFPLGRAVFSNFGEYTVADSIVVTESGIYTLTSPHL